MKKNKIGIMGGTFNPIHNGHIALALAAYEHCELDKVWFMPSGVSYLKEQNEILPAKHRLEMTRLAIADNEAFECSDLEVKREGNTYTVDTLKELSETYKDCDFYFILGADSFMSIQNWKNPELITKLCTLVTVVRDDVDMKELLAQKEVLEKMWNATIVLVPFSKRDISSSQIRKRIHQGLCVDELLPSKVIEYIQKEHLYKQGDFFEDLCGKMKEAQTFERFTHTMGVVDTAVKLAKANGVEVQRAKIAGLLHDCAKCIPYEEQLRLCDKYAVSLSEFEKQNEELIHSKLGAVLAKEVYGIEEQDILDSILNHTTGRPDMSMLEKIIFVADYIEPNRYKAQNLPEIRAIAYDDIDKALVKILEDTLAYLHKKGCLIDENTAHTLRFYKECMWQEGIYGIQRNSKISSRSIRR